ncbi:unnamed protein product [Cunninghamella blakesleeana]
MNDPHQPSHDNNSNNTATTTSSSTSSPFINEYSTLMENKYNPISTSSPSTFHTETGSLHPSEPSSKGPKVIQWTPQQGHADDTMTVVLEQNQHNANVLPMKLTFNNVIVETTQQHQQKNQSIWTTLVAKIPRLENIQQHPFQKDKNDDASNKHNNSNSDHHSENDHHIQISICTYDQTKDHVIDHWQIGTFTYITRNKRTADDDILYNMDTNLYAKKAHTDYIEPSVEFGEGDIMNLISPYNQTQVPTSSSIMENISSSNDPSLPKSINNNKTETNTGYSPMIQRNIPPSPTSQYQPSDIKHKPEQDQIQQTQKRSKQKTDTNITPYPPQPQIMPRSSISFSNSQPPPPPSSSYYNTNTNINNNNNSHNNNNSMTYPSYPPSNTQQQQQQPPLYMQSNTGGYSSHYFPPTQYSYGNNHGNGPDESYMNPPGMPTNIPISPPLQHQQKLMHHHPPPTHHHHHPPTLLPYGPPPTPTSSLTKLSDSNFQDIHHHHHHQQQQQHPFAGIVSRPQLNIHSDLMAATMNWTPKEWEMRRRVLRFWRQQQLNSHQIDCGYEILDEELYRSQRLQLQQESGGDVTSAGGNTSSFKDNLVVSCIYWQERNDFFITSVDCIQLIEGLIGVEFTVEEKNRIRRNLEALRPLTAAKTRPESVEFFKLIMSFPSPKPRNIEKDVKVFLWSTLGPAIKKIVGKYTPSYSSTASVVHYDNQPQQQRNLSSHMSRS